MKRRSWNAASVGLLSPAVAVLCLAGASPQAWAGDSLLWYDGFVIDDNPYSNDAPLNGRAGGSGTFFAGPWIAADQGDEASWAHSIADGLTRPGLTFPPVGGSASREVQSNCCVFTRTSRQFASPWGGFTDPDETYYMGFLINFGTGISQDPHHRTVEMHFGGFSDETNRNLMFGISNLAGLGNELALNVRDSVTDEPTNVVLAEEADLDDLNVQGTHYVVLKFDMSTTSDDVISVFLDPAGTTEPAPSASATVGQFLADRMSTNAQFTSNSGDPSAAGQFDELRVSLAFADVAINKLGFVGVPEPSSMMLAGFGVGVLLMARCKH